MDRATRPGPATGTISMPSVATCGNVRRLMPRLPHRKKATEPAERAEDRFLRDGPSTSTRPRACRTTSMPSAARRRSSPPDPDTPCGSRRPAPGRPRSRAQQISDQAATTVAESDAVDRLVMAALDYVEADIAVLAELPELTRPPIKKCIRNITQKTTLRSWASCGSLSIPMRRCAALAICSRRSASRESSTNQPRRPKRNS